MFFLNIDIFAFYHDNDNKTFNEEFLTPFKLFYVCDTKESSILEEGKGRMTHPYFEEPS